MCVCVWCVCMAWRTAQWSRKFNLRCLFFILLFLLSSVGKHISFGSDRLLAWMILLVYKVSKKRNLFLTCMADELPKFECDVVVFFAYICVWCITESSILDRMCEWKCRKHVKQSVSNFRVKYDCKSMAKKWVNIVFESRLFWNE